MRAASPPILSKQGETDDKTMNLFLKNKEMCTLSKTSEDGTKKQVRQGKYLLGMHLLSTMVGQNLEYAGLKWVGMHFSCPPWLDKILKYAGLKQLEMHLNCPPRLKENLEFCMPETAKIAIVHQGWREFQKIYMIA